MKKILLIAVMMLLLTGCKSKKVFTEKVTEKEETKTENVSQNENKIEKTEDKKETKKSEISEKEKKSETEIEVKGKAEINQPFEIHEIKNGDTLQSFTVTGNAEIHIKNKRSESENISAKTISETIETRLKEFTKGFVNESKLQEKRVEIQKAAKEINTTTGTFWSFGLIAILGGTLIVIFGIIIYLKLK